MKIKFLIDTCKPYNGIRTLNVYDGKGLVETKHCPVCRAEWDEVIRLGAAASDFWISRAYCLECGFFGAYRNFDSSWYEEYYSSNWTNSVAVEAAERSSTSINQNTNYFIQKYVPDREAKILDVGAGYGSSINGLLKLGYKNIEAIELSTRRYNILKSKYPNIKIDQVPLQRLRNSPILSQKYDAVYMMMVLEHVSDIHSCIDALTDAVKEDGYLLINVPRFDGEAFNALVFLYAHQQSFQSHTLDFLLSQYGFERVDQIINWDSTGIRNMYKKVGPKKMGGESRHLVPRQQNLDIYHTKLFTHYQLLYLAYQSQRARKNVLLGTEHYAAFTGANISYPCFYKKTIFRLWTIATEYREKSSSIFAKAFARITGILARPFCFPQGNLLLREVQGIPEDPNTLQKIYLTQDLIKADFLFPKDHIKLWLE